MEQGAGDISHLGRGDWPVVKESRKQQTQEVGGDLRSRVRWSPKLQVLDEGTSTLDPKTEKTINDNLRFSRRFRRFRNAIGKPWSRPIGSLVSRRGSRQQKRATGRAQCVLMRPKAKRYVHELIEQQDRRAGADHASTFGGSQKRVSFGQLPSVFTPCVRWPG